MSTHWDPDFLEEVQAEESPLSPAYPLRGKPLGPARVAGRLVRYAMQGPKELGEIWDRAKQGKATLMDSVTGAMAAINPSFGPGFGAGPRMKAVPWQSRTLDAILGESPVGKKFPNAATPQVWESKLKGAGLPKEEVETARDVIVGLSDPKSKLTRTQVADMLQNPEVTRSIGRNPLPELGVTRTELGGPKWEAAQKRLPEIGDRITELKARRLSMLGEAVRSGRYGTDSRDYGEVHLALKKADPEYRKVFDEVSALVKEQGELAIWSAGKRPGWPEHNIKELKSPREVLYHAPPKEGGKYSNHDMRVHYGENGENLLFHQREGILELPGGKKSTHISEQQSDWISEYSAKKYEYDLGKHGKETFDSLNDAKQFIKENEIKENWETEFAKIKKLESDVPEPPMKDNWWKMGLKDAVKRAVEAGHDYLTWDTPETIIKRGGDKIKGVAENHYGKNVPGFLKKEYGVEVKRVGVSENAPKKSTEVFQIPITEEMKRKVLLEGQYFSKQTAKPGGRDAEMAA